MLVLGLGVLLSTLGAAGQSSTGSAGGVSPGTAAANGAYQSQAPSGVMQGNGAQSGGQGAIPLGSGMPGMMDANSGQAVAGTNAAMYPDPKEYVLSAGDLLTIRLFDSSDYTATDRVSRDGTVVLPLIGSIELAGLTVRQAANLIETRLKTLGMYRNPEITITITEPSVQSTVTFAGEVQRVLPLQRQRTLLEVLASAGGLPPNSSRTITVIRRGNPTPILVNLGNTPEEMAKANIALEPNDTIFIQRLGVIYAVGAFRTTGIFPIQATPTTLLQMAALTGGPAEAAKLSDMRIVRTTGTQRTEIKLDIKKVLEGKAPDPILQAGDILFLPTSILKEALTAGGVNTLLQTISLLLVTTR